MMSSRNDRVVIMRIGTALPSSRARMARAKSTPAMFGMFQSVMMKPMDESNLPSASRPSDASTTSVTPMRCRELTTMRRMVAESSMMRNFMDSFRSVVSADAAWLEVAAGENLLRYLVHHVRAVVCALQDILPDLRDALIVQRRVLGTGEALGGQFDAVTR